MFVSQVPCGDIQHIVRRLAVGRVSARHDIIIARQFRYFYLNGSRFGTADDLYRHGGADSGIADQGRQVGGEVDFVAVEADHDIAHFKPGRLGGAVRQHLRDQRAMRVIHLEGFGQFPGDILDQDAQPAPGNAPVVAQLPVNALHDIGRDREREAHKAARAAVDLRIDADDLTLQVKQRAARIARIDRDIGLNKRDIVFIGQAAPDGADDPGRDRIVKAERRTDRQHPFPDL